MVSNCIFSSEGGTIYYVLLPINTYPPWQIFSIALAAASSPPALSELSESPVRSCRATSDRVGHRNNAAGRPRRGACASPAGSRPSYPSEWRAPERSTKLATSESCLSDPVQVRVRRSLKFAIASRPESLRSRAFGRSVSNS